MNHIDPAAQRNRADDGFFRSLSYYSSIETNMFVLPSGADFCPRNTPKTRKWVWFSRPFECFVGNSCLGFASRLRSHFSQHSLGIGREPIGSIRLRQFFWPQKGP